MNASFTEDSAAVMSAYDSMLSNYNKAMDLITQMRDTPLSLVEDGKICKDCFIRLVACTAVLLRKISETDHDEYLEDCMMVACPELLCEEVSPMPQRADLH